MVKKKVIAPLLEIIMFGGIFMVLTLMAKYVWNIDWDEVTSLSTAEITMVLAPRLHVTESQAGEKIKIYWLLEQFF